MLKKQCPAFIIFILIITILFLPSPLTTFSFAKTTKAPDVVYINGKVMTMDAKNSIKEAVAIKDGKIIAIGSSKKIKALRGPNTVIYNLSGATILPGFIDPHSHWPAAGIYELYYADLNSAPVGSIKSISDIISTLNRYAEKRTDGQWVEGKNYDNTLLAENRHPTKDDLDKVQGNFPVHITHFSGHASVANSKALALAGITKDTPQPAGGKIIKDPVTGEPTGVLEEPAAMNLVRSKIPSLTDEQKLTGIKRSSEIYTAAGVTTANTGASIYNDIALYKKAIAMGYQKHRVVMWPYARSMDAMGQYPSSISGTDLTDNRMITLGAAKLFADGSIQAYTGWLSQPYYVQPSGKTNYRGYPAYADKTGFTNLITQLHAAGWQIAIHGNGDQGIQDILDGFAAAQAGKARKDHRHLIIHSQMVREDQLDQMKTLGVLPNFFVSHTYYIGDRHWNIFMGPDRARRMSPMRTAIDRGMTVTHHNDTPVTPINILLSTWSAVNRISTGGMTIGPEFRISMIEALRGVTINAAYQMFEEKYKGSIEVGKLADLVILDKNPLDYTNVGWDVFKQIKVVRTIVGGQAVMDNGGPAEVSR